MQIDFLRTFVAAARAGSFGATGLVVHASASTVTDRLQRLEERLGVRLFERDRGGCRLTVAGNRLLPVAERIVDAWDGARADAQLAERFTDRIVIGGQTALWPGLMQHWLVEARAAHPALAFEVTAGASARLGRDLVAGLMDLAVTYAPLLEPGIAARKLVDDQLILVTGGEPSRWREDYVQVEWGGVIGRQMMAMIDLPPGNGLVLDLGAQAAHWLAEQAMAGFMPARLVRERIASGELRRVEEVEPFDYPIFACWRRSAQHPAAEELIGSLGRFLR
ncbi:LysR family transcriptional regulator [Sphingomicrobium lutaoense]|uniref:DNA-binding transcriptional LysR family regulator n=1 Tax=Sphingomicrobium lutaoense TaxID=515949 RepID=A0A839YVY9_9SPHN|nr:LysR family transcriptional regulator [Sphingomicrobium lutaoense]MBB3764381.1 DNA-binding transcriptional LysR family regulator [Sphingomicrobium lutaoense]